MYLWLVSAQPLWPVPDPVPWEQQLPPLHMPGMGDWRPFVGSVGLRAALHLSVLWVLVAVALAGSCLGPLGCWPNSALGTT